MTTVPSTVEDYRSVANQTGWWFRWPRADGLGRISHVEKLRSGKLPSPAGPYSHLAVANGFVFTAGFGPQDPATGAVPDGISAQTEAVIANVERALAEVGLDLSHVVKVTAHLADLADFAAYNTVYERMFPAPYPVRTTVGSQLHGILVEIDVVAAQPG
jgi:2-iminobutanoate/2-iminopropanoate deaminase